MGKVEPNSLFSFENTNSFFSVFDVMFSALKIPK